MKGNRSSTAMVKSGRRILGYVQGQQGVLGDGDAPFYAVRLDKAAVVALDDLLSRADREHRCTVTITITSHQPNRLRVTEIDAPKYERLACDTYLRGDALRVNGRVGKTCGLDLSARFGVPYFLSSMREALAHCTEFVIFRVPSRTHDLIEFIPDTMIPSTSDEAIWGASMSAAAQLLPPDDFADWEKT